MRRVLFLLLTFSMSIITVNAWNRRHIIVLQDNSGSYYMPYNNVLINNIQDKIIDLFNNKKINNEYSTLNNELDKGGIFYDSQQDFVSFYWFVADQGNNVRFYKETNGNYHFFENYFLQPGQISFNGSSKIDDFLRENFVHRPPLTTAANSVGISTYSFSAYAYPLCMDVIQTDYTEEYVVIIISDFNAGSTFGNRNDEKIFRDAFKNKSADVLRRVNFLNSQFFKIDYFDYYKTNKYNGFIGFTAFKIRPNIGTPIPENVDFRINSNIELKQQSFGSNQFSLQDAEVVFSHNESLKLQKASIWILQDNGSLKDTLDVTDNVSFDKEKGVYRFNRIKSISISECYNKRTINGEFKFVFYMNYHTDEGKIVKYTYSIGHSLDNRNFIFKTKLSTAQMAGITLLILLVMALIVAVFLHVQGKPLGLELHRNSFNDTFEDVDFSSNGGGRIHTEYVPWSGDRLIIPIEGKLTYRIPHRLYNWKERSGFPVSITPQTLKTPDGFSIYLTTDCKITNNPEITITTDSFENGKFSFEIVIQKSDAKPLLKPSLFNIEAEVVCRCVGTFRKFYYSKRLSFAFHSGPELGDVWVGVDPGTTGSCIATATDTHDLTIEKDGHSDKITDSVVVIKTEGLTSTTKDELRKHALFGAAANSIREGQNYKKFVSIKKLLGYNEDFLLKEIGQKKLYVQSSFLSTLLIEGLFDRHKSFLESQAINWPQFLENSQYLPKRAVFAIPNNFTATKIKHLKECILASTVSSLKEIRFIYEAEAILVSYINSNWGEKNKLDIQASPTGENIFIFDMGGATINATLANIKKRGSLYDISILAKLGYGIGGDTIDYAFLKWVYSKKQNYQSLQKTDPFSSSTSMAQRRELKSCVLAFKQQIIKNYNSSRFNKLLDRSDIKRYFDADLIGATDAEGNETYVNDPFEKDIQKDRSNFLTGPIFQELIWDNVCSIVNDIISICQDKGVSTLNTVIMSGRSSHFPLVREKVASTIKATFSNASVHLLQFDESKSAVAKGACYYGVQNSSIKLHNRGVSGTFGVIQTLHTPTNPPTFHQLIYDGAHFQKGSVSNSTEIKEENAFNWDGRKVRFCQVMGVHAADVIAKKEKHKYSEIAVIKAQPYAVQKVTITVTEKDKVLCQITDVNGNIISPQEDALVNDADIIACNDEQYTFFVKQS